MDRCELSLWLKFKSGDVNALFTIHELTYPDLLKSGDQITKDRDLINDTINNLFLFLWDKRAGLNPPLSVKSYIIVSFRRKLILEIKFHANNDPVEEYALQGFTNSHEYDLIVLQSDFESKLKVKNAINKLPKRQKELIILKYYEELSYKEMSIKTSLRVRTIYNKLHEAIKFLKVEMK